VVSRLSASNYQFTSALSTETTKRRKQKKKKGKKKKEKTKEDNADDAGLVNEWEASPRELNSREFTLSAYNIPRRSRSEAASYDGIPYIRGRGGGWGGECISPRSFCRAPDSLRVHEAINIITERERVGIIIADDGKKERP
jgi:hypothetical protein